eukprot:23285_1
MVNTNYIKAGRLVRILRGPREDRVGVITDIIDANRVLVQNPEDDKMWTHVQNLKNVEPLKFAVAIKRGASAKEVKVALADKKSLAKYAATKKAQSIAAKIALENSTDFERYQLRVAKRSKAHHARKLFDAADDKAPTTWYKKTAAKLGRAHKKFADKKLKVRHDRIKAFFTKRKAKKAGKK